MLHYEVGKHIRMQTWFCLTEETDHRQMPVVVLPNTLGSHSSYERCHRTSTNLRQVCFHFASFQLDVLLLSLLLFQSFLPVVSFFFKLLLSKFSCCACLSLLVFFLFLSSFFSPFCFLVFSPELVVRGSGQ